MIRRGLSIKDQKRFHRLVTKKCTGSATVEECAELERLSQKQLGFIPVVENRELIERASRLHRELLELLSHAPPTQSPLAQPLREE